MTKIAPGYIENDLITRDRKGMNVQLNMSTVNKIKRAKKFYRESHDETLNRVLDYYIKCHREQLMEQLMEVDV